MGVAGDENRTESHQSLKVATTGKVKSMEDSRARLRSEEVAAERRGAERSTALIMAADSIAGYI